MAGATHPVNVVDAKAFMEFGLDREACARSSSILHLGPLFIQRTIAYMFQKVLRSFFSLHVMECLHPGFM